MYNVCVVVLINASATERIKTSPNRTHIKQKLDGKLAKISKWEFLSARCNLIHSSLL